METPRKFIIAFVTLCLDVMLPLGYTILSTLLSRFSIRRNFARGAEFCFVLSCFSGGTKAGFPLGGTLRAERNFSLSCDFSGGTN